MPNDTAPAWDGRPQMPEVDAFHWLLRRNGAWPEAWLWQSDADGCGTEYSGAWAESDSDGQPDTMARWYSYLGPCLTPSEVATIRAEALREALKIARDAIPTASPPQTDHYGAHVAGERAAAERIVQRLAALIPATKEPPHGE